jgi:hypothetical protein
VPETNTQARALLHGKRRRVGGMRQSQSLLIGHIDSRTQSEQSSIIFEHCSMLFEFRSMSADCVTIAKPSGLGMVSSRALKLLE